jgi:hypothetical protein
VSRVWHVWSFYQVGFNPSSLVYRYELRPIEEYVMDDLSFAILSTLVIVSGYALWVSIYMSIKDKS